MLKLRTKFHSLLILLVTAVLAVVFGLKVKGQTRVYATIYRNSGSGVTGPTLSTDGIYTNFTTLKASSLIFSEPPAWNQMIFGSNISSGTPIYIRCTMTGALLGGDLTATAYSGSSSSSDGTSVSATSSSITDYLIIKPTATFNSARATITPPALAGTNTANIYYAFYIPAPTLTNTTICSGSQASLAVASPNSNLVYNWYTAATGGDLVHTGTTYSPSLSATTTYYVEGVESGTFSSARTAVTVTVNPLPTLTITQTATTITTASTISFTATSSAATVRWYDNTGSLKFTGTNPTFGPFSTPGTYTYNVIADNGTCTNSATVTFAVYSTTACPTLTKRVYASNSTWSTVITGTVADVNNAVDGDPKTNSTLTSPLGLLGIGTVTQDLFWSSTVAAGTPTTVKLGLGSGLLALATNVSIVGIKKNGVLDPIVIGSAQAVNTSLLKLLPGDNTFEVTITPSNSTGPSSYDGIRVILGSLVSLGQTARIFDAYYLESTLSVDCIKGDVIDIVYGVKDLGIGALTSTVGVTNAWNSVDGNENTFATLHSGVGILAQAREQVIFSSPSLFSDSLKIITSTGGSLLGVDLLNGFSIQRYLGNSIVGTPISSSSTLLSIKLLSGGTRAAILLAPTTEPYDRIEILYGGVAGVLGTLNIHEIQRITSTKLSTAPNNDNKISVCKGDLVSLPTPLDNCTTFKWYDAATGGNLISGSTINTGSYTGVKTFYIQPVRFGCELMARGSVTITINELPTASISGSTTVCQNTTAPTITFTAGSTGTAPYTFSYNINGGATQTVVTTVGNSVTLSAPTTTTGSSVYNLLSVKDNSSTQCTNAQTGAATVTIAPIPTITLGSIADICQETPTGSIPFTSVTAAPSTYTIIWDTNALAKGFVNVNNAALGSSPISFTKPTSSSLTPGIYTATLTVSTATCTSTGYPVSFTILPRPPTPTLILHTNPQ